MRSILLTVSLFIALTGTNVLAQPCKQGYWEPPFNHADPRLNPADPWFSCPPPTGATTTAIFAAIHLALIPTGENQGRVLAVDWSIDIFAKAFTYKQRYAVIDPGDPSQNRAPQFWNAIHDHTGAGEPPGDMMCGGHAWTEDGKLFWASGNAYSLTQGTLGHKKCWLYIPEPSGSVGAGSFQYVGDLQDARWYPTVTHLGYGVMMISGGRPDLSVQLNSYELYSVPLRLGFGPISGPTMIASPLHDYPRIHLLPEGLNNSLGLVFSAGEEPHSAITDILFLGLWWWGQWGQPATPARINGSSVLYPNLDGVENSVWRLGGAPTTSITQPTNTVESTDAVALFGSWSPRPTMTHPRTNQNLVLLPDGTLCVIGGTRNNPPIYWDPTNLPDPVFEAELLAPNATAWVETPPMASPRIYHSTAVLLADGRVLSAGGDPGDLFAPIPGHGRMWDYQVYVPPYLACGNERPVIVNAPATMPRFNPSQPTTQTITFQPLTTPGLTVSKVVLMAPGAVTHAFDHHQRYIELPVVGNSATSITVNAPAPMGVTTSIAAHAPPGYYMLFLLTSAGVPSVASWVQVTP